jgi:hypothetical protein
MAIKKALILLFVITVGSILFSCKTSTIIGHWVTKKHILTEFVFFADSTFIYNRADWKTKNHSSGKWMLKDKKIIINSDTQNIIIPIEILYAKKSNNNKNCISVNVNVQNKRLDYYTEKDYISEPFTNDSVPLRKPLELIDITGLSLDESFAKIDKWFSERRGSYIFYVDTILDNICFEILKNPYYIESLPPRVETPIKTETRDINFALGDSITININIDDSFFGYRIFNNTVLQIKNKHIIFDNDKENIINKLYYQSEKPENNK